MSCPYRLRWLDHHPFKVKNRDRRPVGTPDKFVPDAQRRLTLWRDGLSTPGMKPLKLRLEFRFEAEHGTHTKS